MYNVYENINDFLNNYKEECVVFCVANNAVIAVSYTHLRAHET